MQLNSAVEPLPKMSSKFSEKLDEINLLVPILVVENDNRLQLGLVPFIIGVPKEGFVILENGV